MLGLSVIILFKSLLHVFCSLVFSAHNSSGGETAAAGTKVRKKCTSSSQVALASYIGQLMHSLMHILDC